MLLKLQVCSGMCVCVLSLSGLVSLCISKKQLLLPSSITLRNVLKRKAYFNSSLKQTSLERHKSMTLGRIARREDKGIRVLYPAMPITMTFIYHVT